MGPSGALALIAFLADSSTADAPSAHLLAGLSDEDAAAEPALRSRWRGVQALWLGHRLLAACSGKFGAAVGRFLELRAASRAPREEQTSALREARAWAACVAGGSKVLVEAAVAALSLRSDDRDRRPARAWLELLHVQAARALGVAAASCGRAFDGFAVRVLPLLLARALKAGAEGAAPVGEAVGAALSVIAAAAAEPASALAKARQRLLPLPRPIRSQHVAPAAHAGAGGVEAGRGRGHSVVPRTALALASSALAPARQPPLPAELSALLSAHAGGLTDVAISQLHLLAEMSLPPDNVSGGDLVRLAHAPRVAALLVANAAVSRDGLERAALLPLLQDVSNASIEALRALSSGGQSNPGDTAARGKLAVDLLGALEAVIGAAAGLGLPRGAGEDQLPACVLSDALDEAPVPRPRGVAARLRAARSARALCAVQALPFLPLGARDVVMRAMLAAAEHLSAAAALFGASGAAPTLGTDAAGTRTLRVTLAALRAVMSGCEALARHPETLNPVLHLVWPSIVALLPPLGFAASAIDAAQARAQEGGRTSGLSIDDDNAGDSAAPLAVFTAPVSGEVGPAALAGLPTLLEQTRAFMVRRAAALAKARQEPGAGSSPQPAMRHSAGPGTRRLGLPANEDRTSLLGGRDAALVEELASESTGGAASEGGAGAAATRNASPSALTLLVHCAALDFVAALASAPEDRRGGGCVRGACAGDFLRSRFAADVWPRLRGVLLACAVRHQSASANFSAMQRLFVSALSAVRRLSLPTVTIAAAQQLDDDAGGRSAGPALQMPPPPSVVQQRAPLLAGGGPEAGLAFECAVIVTLGNCGKGCNGSAEAHLEDAAARALCALRGFDAHAAWSAQ